MRQDECTINTSNDNAVRFHFILHRHFPRGDLTRLEPILIDRETTWPVGLLFITNIPAAAKGTGQINKCQAELPHMRHFSQTITTITANGRNAGPQCQMDIFIRNCLHRGPSIAVCSLDSGQLTMDRGHEDLLRKVLQPHE